MPSPIESSGAPTSCDKRAIEPERPWDEMPSSAAARGILRCLQTTSKYWNALMSTSGSLGTETACKQRNCTSNNKAQDSPATTVQLQAYSCRDMRHPMAANETFPITNIVIVGAGASGVSAAVQAAQLGAKVVLLEKQDVVGGTGIGTEGLFAVGSKMQEEAGISTRWGSGCAKPYKTAEHSKHRSAQNARGTAPETRDARLSGIQPEASRT